MQWDGELARLAQLTGYQPHDGQLEIHRDRSRWRVIANGRRFGKTTLCAFEAVAVAALGGWVMIVAPTYASASICWQATRAMIQQGGLAPLILSIKIAPGSQEILLATGGRIVSRSSDAPASLVGEGWDLIVFDEAAKEPSPDPFHRYLRPSLSDHAGSALFPSTPEGDNWFKDLWDRSDHGLAGYKSWQMPSSVNPVMTEDEVADLAEGLTQDDYDQEILAKFVASSGSVFRGYGRVAIARWREIPEPGHRYVLGIDPAKHKDFTVIAVLDATTRHFVHLMRFNDLDFTIQEPIMLQASRHWNDAAMIIDATRDESTADHLAASCYWADVIPWKFTLPSKVQVINQFKLAIELQAVKLLDRDQIGNVDCSPEARKLCRVAYGEVGRYEYQKTPSGLLTMNAPQGKHDDVVTACVLAYELAMSATGGMPTVIREADPSSAPVMAGRYTPSSSAARRPVPKMSRR